MCAPFGTKSHIHIYTSRDTECTLTREQNKIYLHKRVIHSFRWLDLLHCALLQLMGKWYPLEAVCTLKHKNKKENYSLGQQINYSILYTRYNQSYGKPLKTRVYHYRMSLALCPQVVSQAPQHHIFRDKSHLWWLFCPPDYLPSQFPSLWHVQGSTSTGTFDSGCGPLTHASLGFSFHFSIFVACWLNQHG